MEEILCPPTALSGHHRIGPFRCGGQDLGAERHVIGDNLYDLVGVEVSRPEFALGVLFLLAVFLGLVFEGDTLRVR